MRPRLFSPLPSIRIRWRIVWSRQTRRRNFLTFANSASPQSLAASSSLPYPALAIYEIITDIPSYPDFIPYILSSRVLQHSRPDAYYKREWPQLATLRIGYGDSINEEFTSKLWCVPPVLRDGTASHGIVEAVSGSMAQDNTQIPPEQIAHHVRPQPGHGSPESPSGRTNDTTEQSPLEFLRTRWTLRASPFIQPQSGDSSGISPALTGGHKTDIRLSIEYKFRSPVYDMLVATVAPKMAENMIKAFEKRVNQVLGAR